MASIAPNSVSLSLQFLLCLVRALKSDPGELGKKKKPPPSNLYRILTVFCSLFCRCYRVLLGFTGYCWPPARTAVTWCYDHSWWLSLSLLLFSSTIEQKGHVTGYLLAVSCRAEIVDNRVRTVPTRLQKWPSVSKTIFWNVLLSCIGSLENKTLFFPDAVVGYFFPPEINLVLSCLFERVKSRSIETSKRFQSFFLKWNYSLNPKMEKFLRGTMAASRKRHHDFRRAQN